MNAAKCPPCGKMFAKHRELAFHAKQHACEQKRRIRCVKRAAAFLCGNSLDCDRCGKTFKRRKDLNYHVRHLCGIRGIQCPYCNKCYTYTSNVKYHISRCHKGKEVYYNKLCDYRGDQFYKWNDVDLVSYSSAEMKSLLNRYRYHPDERKRFECLNCGCRFTQKTTMTRHLRYFCGQGHRYQCPYCDMKASCSSNVYRHVRSRHAGYKAHAIKLFASINPRRTM
ncbi:unnamed protein product [Xylocopa violacea]|uniref:C2H2-type domain-containing protein n=1 Tax=Xylocopa violacea TaxID=135666 RepID=A0ABP1NFX3_XYLVO